MAQKRMFDKRITDSDKFMDLPNSSKALYFMAGMSADDRGFFQPRRLQKMSGFTDDDFKVEYIDNVNVGTATITITGANNCTGELTYTFNILKKVIKKELWKDYL